MKIRGSRKRVVAWHNKEIYIQDDEIVSFLMLDRLRRLLVGYCTEGTPPVRVISVDHLESPWKSEGKWINNPQVARKKEMTIKDSLLLSIVSQQDIVWV